MLLSTWSEQNSLIFAYVAKVSLSARAIDSESTYKLEVDILIVVEPLKLILLLGQIKTGGHAHSHFDHAFAALIRVSSSTELS